MFQALMRRWESEQESQDFRAGMIASIIANVNRDPKRSRRPYTPQDFMPRRRPEPQKIMTVEQSVDFVALLNRTFGGVDLRQKAIA